MSILSLSLSLSLPYLLLSSSVLLIQFSSWVPDSFMSLPAVRPCCLFPTLSYPPPPCTPEPNYTDRNLSDTVRPNLTHVPACTLPTSLLATLSRSNSRNSADPGRWNTYPHFRPTRYPYPYPLYTRPVFYPTHLINYTRPVPDQALYLILNTFKAFPNIFFSEVGGFTALPPLIIIWNENCIFFFFLIFNIINYKTFVYICSL